MTKIAVLLFNLGGPDSPAAVKPFLHNLFSDPAILRVPNWLRPALAWLIAWRRTPKAQAIYALIGGGSPILPNTETQARALEQALIGIGSVRCYPVMRYWHPRAEAVISQLAQDPPDVIIRLPLYPQYSTTTTASSFAEFDAMIRQQPVLKNIRCVSVCCYPTDPGFITTLANQTRPMLEEAAKHGRPRLLLSAHGLPEKIIAAGDPYQWQCEQTARALVAALGMPGLDWLNCYQSRVGPLSWIGPATDEALHQAARDRVPVVLVPIAFVSEHSETLVELDIEYRHLAEQAGIPYYARVPTVAALPDFIQGLAAHVRRLMQFEGVLRGAGVDGSRLCPREYQACPCLT